MYWVLLVVWIDLNLFRGFWLCCFGWCVYMGIIGSFHVCVWVLLLSLFSCVFVICLWLFGFDLVFVFFRLSFMWLKFVCLDFLFVLILSCCFCMFVIILCSHAVVWLRVWIVRLYFGFCWLLVLMFYSLFGWLLVCFLIAIGLVFD